SDSESDSETNTRVLRSRIIKTRRALVPSSGKMDQDQLRTVVEAAIANALAEQAAINRQERNALTQRINELSEQVAAAHVAPPTVQTYATIDIRADVRCDEPLDAVKCLPEFDGSQES
ncbi:hypothetical protein KR093_001937, partial [Drosophila rubida]